jgi:hypothetical protein
LIPVVMRSCIVSLLLVTVSSARVKILYLSNVVPGSFLNFLIQFQDADPGFPLMIPMSVAIQECQIVKSLVRS